jgi:hypothetical protein
MLYLEMSSASLTEVYRRVLSDPRMHDRLLFGSDLPYGLITGVEAWSETHGAVFVTRDRYPWSDPALEENSSLDRNQLTYNTYHVIKGFKDALESMQFSQELVETIKEKVFFRNARSLIEPAATDTMHGTEGSSSRTRRSAGTFSHDSR